MLPNSLHDEAGKDWNTEGRAEHWLLPRQCRVVRELLLDIERRNMRNISRQIGRTTHEEGGEEGNIGACSVK